MSSEPTSSAAPVTTTVNEVTTAVDNNIVPPTDINIEKLDDKFSYDDTSKNLSIAMIILALILIIGYIIRFVYSKSVYSKYRYIVLLLESLIIVAYIVIFSLLANHYKKLHDSVILYNVPQKCNGTQDIVINSQNCHKYVRNYSNSLSNQKVYTRKSGGVLAGGIVSTIIFIFVTFVLFKISV